MKKPIGMLLMLGMAWATEAQTILPMKLSVQEHDQWCWAGVSSSLLDYYCKPTTQCAIAEYTRTVATWHSFGSANCCSNPNSGCNYWNYNWGNAGSIQDILVHFAGAFNTGVSSQLSLAEIDTELAHKRPFVVRWGWYSGGGHFVIGHGVSGNMVYYMNPWPGEGKKIATYDWLVDDGDHQWTHTNTMNTDPAGAQPIPVFSQ